MELDEALSIQQRIKRANIAHRNANKLKISRDRAARKLAPENNIKKRAYALARKILRKRVAGGRGAVYQELGPTEKIAIDKQLDKKKALIKKIALRLIPKIRQSEQHRLQSFLKGKAMKNDAINEAFEKKFADKKKKKKSESGFIKILDKFTEEAEIDSKAYKALVRKADKYEVDLETIVEIYNSAFEDYDSSTTSLTAEQFAFARVNHNLQELSKDAYKDYINTAYKSRDKEFMGRKNMVTMEKRKKGIQTASRLLNKKVDESREMSPAFKAAQQNLSNLRKGIKPEVKKTPTWKQHMASYDKEEKAKYHEHKKHYEYHKAELKDLHHLYKDLHSGNLGIHKDDKEGQHGAEEEIESMKDKHREKMNHHFNKMHYHNNNLSKPLQIKEDIELQELSMRTMGSYNEKARTQLKTHASAATERLSNKIRDPKAAKACSKVTRKRYKGLGTLARKITNEGRFIVSGVHQDQGYPKTKIYNAKSEEHARKQFNDEFDNFHANKIKKLTLNKLRNEQHSDSLDEFVITASLLAGIAASKKAKKEIPKATNYVKNKTFTQAKHLKDKVASIISKKADSRMSNAEYLKKKEAQIKEQTADIRERIEKLKHNVNESEVTMISNTKGAPDYKAKMLNRNYKKDHVLIRTKNSLGKEIDLVVHKSFVKEDAVNEVLGPENQIGTKALVNKLKKVTPGQEKAQVNEQNEKELIHHAVIIRKSNRERKNLSGGNSSDHKIIKWSKQYDINPNLKSFSGRGAGYNHQLAHKNVVNNHPEVKKHLKSGWSIDTFKVDASKKSVLNHINDRLSYIKNQNGDIHLVEEIGRLNELFKLTKEDVKSAETKGIIVPSYVDSNGNTIPAKVVKRKVGNKILSTGNVHDGK